jgi:WXG100 family type VII secretion target
MSDFIKVPYAELFQRAIRIRQEADTIRAEIKTLKDTVASIEWIGRRADKFFSMWQETVPEMENWVTILENFAAELEDQARRMQAADEAF